MTEDLTVHRHSIRQSYAAGYADSKRFISMYKAYLAGASDAADDGERERIITKLCMMCLIFAGWTIMLFFVFKR